jgi:hypothetical protein
MVAAGLDRGYSLSFVATEFLLSRSGLTSVVTFYRMIGGGATWAAAFKAAFGMSVDTFYEEFEDYRRRGFVL